MVRGKFLERRFDFFRANMRRDIFDGARFDVEYVRRGYEVLSRSAIATAPNVHETCSTEKNRSTSSRGSRLQFPIGARSTFESSRTSISRREHHQNHELFLFVEHVECSQSRSEF